jgi:hypothetical protein
MATTPTAPTTGFALPSKHLPEVEQRDMPEPPRQMWKIIGPGVVGAGIGLASGEFILWPYIASQVGLVFLWGAVVGVMTQWFINMEIERYTLATGETALTGFSRLWRHWGLVFVIMVYFANMWPGWATSSAALMTYLFGGGNVNYIAIVLLLIIGAGLTLAPVVYTMVERVIFLKVAAITLFVIIAAVFAITAKTWSELPSAVTHFGQVPAEKLGWALVLGAVVFAGAGGGQNLCQSNWIRDKGFGMGAYVPRLVSPVTGEEEAAPGTGFVFPTSDANLSRWRRWWRFANWEQLLTVPVITVFTIAFMSMLAASTVFGRDDVPNDIGFLNIEAQVLSDAVAPWFGALFLVIGAFSLFAAAFGIVDYTSRLAADQLKTAYLRTSAITESRLYFLLVWGLVAIGILILLLGLDQPLVLLVISACVGGGMMFVYSILLLVLNRKTLPAPLRVRSYRVVALLWSIALFGVLSVITIIEQGKLLLGGG